MICAGNLLRLLSYFVWVIFVDGKAQNHVFVNNDFNGLRSYSTAVSCAKRTVSGHVLFQSVHNRQ